MRECRCERPRTSPDPRDDEACLRCLGHLRDEWLSNDATVKEFFDRLEESMFTLAEIKAPVPTAALAAFRDFRMQAEVRELAGRTKFGHSHLSRDNEREATEEAADLANYMNFSLLSARRNGDQEEWALALTAAKHAALAHRYALLARAHRHGSFS